MPIRSNGIIVLESLWNHCAIHSIGGIIVPNHRAVLWRCQKGQPPHPRCRASPPDRGDGMEDAAASHSREFGAEVDSGGRVESRSDKENQLPCVSPQLRDSSAGKRIGYPHSSGTARACGCEYDDDLHSRPATGTTGSPKPAGSVVS